MKGTLSKMLSSLENPVQYLLPVGSETIEINKFIGKELEFVFTGTIYCKSCGKKTKKSFHQGFCYSCFLTVPEAAECIMRPELCRAHEGFARDMEWSKKNCLTEHYVYLAVSSGLKVGVTRASQIPTRWIDQGAEKAIKLAVTPNRYLAGVIEVALKPYLNDKTSWQKMLKNEQPKNIELEDEKQKAWELLDQELQEYITEDDEITEINYPVIQYPVKVKSINFDKIPEFKGKLMGIKGQYLIFENAYVLNIRKHTGYEVEFKLMD